jgi:biopolymer transport protein ExbB
MFLLFALLLQSAFAAAWWNEDWAFRKQIQVDVSGLPKTTADGKPVVLPLMVRLHPGNFQYFNDMQQTGADIRFMAGDDKTPLKYHFETFDPVNGTALIWVAVPYSSNAVTSGSLTIENVWMYYGNPNATPAQDRPGTYGIDYGLVYHFDESGVPSDAGAYGNQPASFTSQVVDSGYIGRSAGFNGNTRIDIPVTPSMAYVPDKGLELSMWLKVNNAQSEAVIAEFNEGAIQVQLLVDELAVLARARFATGEIETAKVSNLVPGTWQHVGMALAHDQLSLSLNGKQVAYVSVELPAFSGRLSIGARADGGQGFVGQIDSLILRNQLPDPKVVERIVETQSVGSVAVSYGGDEQVGGGNNDADYFTAILNSMSIDGWLVVFTLAAMFSVSLIIIVAKALLLSRIRKDNVAFLADYRKVDPNHPEALYRAESEEEREMSDSPVFEALFGKHDHYQSSTLYRLYHVGMQELTSRVGRSVGAQASELSPQSVAAIKAALDASLVREQQRLNRMMVMLTIAISGGPFLGLLGTVLGVMITFAAIAVSGDVNINAIAPGVSAALMTTVAGLAVAIPALFAYNYLSTRIRDTTIDMRVFVDELVARIAEYHR